MMFNIEKCEMLDKTDVVCNHASTYIGCAVCQIRLAKKVMSMTKSQESELLDLTVAQVQTLFGLESVQALPIDKYTLENFQDQATRVLNEFSSW